MYIYLLLFVLLVIAFFDIYWIIRLAVTRLLSKVANYSEYANVLFYIEVCSKPSRVMINKL